jgi:hypothetical protein
MAFRKRSNQVRDRSRELKSPQALVALPKGLADLFLTLLFSFAIDAKSRHRPGFEARYADIFAATFADTKISVFDAL